jgi:hypothetical protein
VPDPFVNGAPPASVRNAPVIRDVLARVFASQIENGGLVLEIASGSGYHAYFFAQAFPKLRWQPTDADEESCHALAAVVKTADLKNLRAPLHLNVCAPWPIKTADALVCINMIHISPWAATLALFAGAAKILTAGAPLVTYGPYSINDDFLAESNIAFDQSLQARNPAWGIRDVKDVTQVAGVNGFQHMETVRMPANNLTLVFKRA